MGKERHCVSSERVPKMKDVAQHAGVSVATVSYVLNGTKPLSRAVEERVQASISALGFRPSHTAQALRTGKSETVGLIIPDLTNPFFPKLAQDIEREAQRQGYAVLLSDSHNDPQLQARAIQQLVRRGVDCLVIVPALGARHIPALPIPAVLLDRPLHDVPCVYCDERAGGHAAASHLLALGHQKFSILAGPDPALHPGMLPSERILGMREALSDAGITLPESRVVHSSYGTEGGTLAVEYLIAAGEPFTAVLAANDTLALGALHALLRHDRRVPNDVSLVGFDDIPWSAVSFPTLTTVHQDTHELARRAIQLALGCTGQGAEPIPTQLVIRQSSGVPSDRT